MDCVFSVGEQPCDNFTPDSDYVRNGYAHECYKCGGIRVFCVNCHYDHHAGGWEACKNIKEQP